MSNYDSTIDTYMHMENVRKFMDDILKELTRRKVYHDDSKLQEPEKSMYDEYKPKIKEIEQEFGYGSKEYEAVVKQLGEALKHHFANNRHHPEHFENGVADMNLVDIVEMLCDWKAASYQYNTELNLPANKKRFNIPDALYRILENTVRDLGW